MGCDLQLEYCTRSCGCANCIHNSSRRVQVEYSEIDPMEFWREEELRRMDIDKNVIPKRKEHLREIASATVVPLLGDNVDGNGFFIFRHFVTAAHCLDNGPIQFKYKDRMYTFQKEDAVIFHAIDKTSEEPQVGDIAIFKFDEAEEYLSIGRDMSAIDTIFPEKLLLPHYRREDISSGEASIFATSETRYILEIDEFVYEDSILEEIRPGTYISHMFQARTNVVLKEGSSGSPLINKNNEVVGMLIGCLHPSDPYCILFQHLEGYGWSL